VAIPDFSDCFFRLRLLIPRFTRADITSSQSSDKTADADEGAAIMGVVNAFYLLAQDHPRGGLFADAGMARSVESSAACMVLKGPPPADWTE
jgi:hypothetical protein